MKRLLAALLFAALTASCSTPTNSSTVSYQLDGNGCLVDVSGYDIFNEVETEEGIRSVNYVWECGDYFNEAAGIDATESKVTLIFGGTGCLKLTATMIGAGYCTQGKAPIL